MSAAALVQPVAPVAAAQPCTTTTCRGLYDYYLEARGARLLLPHAELDPARLASLLPQVMLYELQDVDTYRVRLCGTAFRQWFGDDLTGRNWLNVSHPTDLIARQRRVAQAALQPCGVHTRLWQFRDGMPRRKFESLTLPLQPRRAEGPAIMLMAMAELAPDDLGKPNELMDFAQCRRVDWSFVDLGAGVPDPAGW
jgi:hypothetical protein